MKLHMAGEGLQEWLCTSICFVVFGFGADNFAVALDSCFHLSIKVVSSFIFSCNNFFVGDNVNCAVSIELDYIANFHLTNRLSITHPLATSILLFGAY
ncbi:MAG: hypothetical protein IPL26_00005 [Leptospiraceae bacterium]|nr:hypothetical protein [Leptospiraceae bacterium]